MRSIHIAVLVVAFGATIPAPGASAQSQSAGVARGPGIVQAEQGQANVHQLANRVRKVIKLIEENTTIPCETRNHFVQRLRMLDDALESGRRSAARAMVVAWASEARSSQRAGLLSAAHGSILHNGLQGLLEEIGTGWPAKPGPMRKWDPLPACDATAAPGLVGATSGGVWQPDDALVIITTLVGEIPFVGGLVSGLLEILWPASGQDVTDLIDEKIDQATIDYVIKPALNGLKTGVSESFLPVLTAWQADCHDYGEHSTYCTEGAQTVYNSWDSVHLTFKEARSQFQTENSDYRLRLLPLFTQYENLYLSFLREGILLAPSWIASGRVGQNLAAIPGQRMAEELNPAFVNPDSGKKDRGVAYIDTIYQQGLDAQPAATNWDDWKSRNNYVRDKTLQVMDFRNTWQFMDPAAYPQGVPGGVKLTRMIYSDPVGHKTDADFDTFVPPPNVAGPLRELTVFSQDVPSGTLNFSSPWAISAIQSTNPPSAGPARSGELSGDYSHDGKTKAEWLDLRVSGPITQVQVRKDTRGTFYRWVPSSIDFKTAASGTWFHTGGSGYAESVTFKYQGHVMAAAKALGRYDMSNGYTTDAVIFGFRYGGSFFPSGALVSVASGKCMDVRYLTAGTQPTIYSCTGTAGQVWTYDTNTKAITIGEPDLCLRATGTATGSKVVIDACTGAKNEQWELVPTATGLSGLVKSVESGLALDVSGGGTADRTPIVLWYAHGDTNQQWTLTSPLQGEVHGIGSGRCLDVKSGDAINGTPVQIYDCNGTAAQTWKYDETLRTLSAYGGTKCLDASGSAAGATLRIWDCSGSSNQQWQFNRDGTITGGSGLVLDVLNGSMKIGSPVVLAAVANRTSQWWSRPSRTGGNIHATYAGKCLDVPNLFNGTPAQISACLAAPAPGQEWTYHPLTQRLTVSGEGTTKCLGSVGSSSGAPVVANECAADPDQLWILAQSSGGVGGTIVNATSGLCMTLPGTGTVTAAGTKVQLQTCVSDPASPNQQWIWP